MSRPTRNETLKAWNRQDYWWDDLGSAQGDVSVLLQAAEAYARLAPDTCPECGGYGTTMIRVQEPSVYGTTIHEGPKTVDCPSCGGRGYVWPDTTVKRVMDFLDDLILEAGVARFEKRESAMRSAPDLLDVLWEVGDDN